MHKERSADLEHSRQQGFSLLELTVAMGLSLLLLGMVVQLFDQLYYLSDSAIAITDANQTVRASIKLLARDLKLAGSGIPTGGIPLPTGTGIPSVNRSGVAGQSFPPTVPAGPPVLSAVTPGQNTCNGPSTIKQRCDEVTIIMVDPVSQLNQSALTGVTTTQITMDPTTDISPAGKSPVNVGDLIMVTNINGAAINYVTARDPVTRAITFAAGDPMQLNQPTATAGTIASLKVTCSGSPPTCTPQTYAYRVIMMTYYLDNTDATQPKLMKQVGWLGLPTVVGSNLTGLQFTYDLSDGLTVNQPAVDKRNQIRKVNVVVTARSTRPLRKSKSYFSNTLSTTVMLRNLAYSNKYAT